MPLGDAVGRPAIRIACAVAAAGGLAGGLGALGANVATAHSSPARALGGVPGSPQSAARGLDVLPVPGTPDAPPGTPIDFPAIAPGQIATVRAVGSRSGLHAGRLSAQPQHAGTQFAPRRPFAPGERVSVTALLRSAAAGTASGAPGARKLRFSFSIARPAHVRTYSNPFAPGAGGIAASPDTLGVSAAALKPGYSRGTHSYVTQPRFHAPTITMSGKDTDHASGNIFMTAQNTGQNGPYFLSPNGDLRWYHPTSGPGHGKGPAAFDFRVQYYNKQPYLTYWEGHLNFPPGDGTGVGVMLGVHYRRVHTVTAGAGYQSDGVDLHEFSIGANGNAFVTVYAPVHTNLTSVGGPANGVVFDCIAQEINIKTNRVLWEWDALRHVPVYDSYAHYTPGQPFDYFHMNSIQELPNGHVIISSRHMWAVYSVDMRTGKIAWTLGGRHSYFWMGSGSHFYWQHDATLHAGGLLTLFDDGAGDGALNESQSRAVEIHLNIKSRHATLVRSYLHSPALLTTSMGSAQIVQNHNVFVGWGGGPSFSEYQQGGGEIFKGEFQRPIASYRAFRSGAFVGQPASPPRIAVRKASKGGGDKIYASWNGSSLVAKWRLLAGSSKSKLATVKEVSWAGFETTIKAAKAKYFRVQALTAKGHALPHGTSAVVAGR